MARKKGRYPTCTTDKTKLNETKPIKVIYAAINSKLMNILRPQGTTRNHNELKQRQYNPATTSTLLWLCCISFVPAPCAWLQSDRELPSLKTKNSHHMDE